MQAYTALFTKDPFAVLNTNEPLHSGWVKPACLLQFSEK